MKGEWISNREDYGLYPYECLIKNMHNLITVIIVIQPNDDYYVLSHYYGLMNPET